MTFQAIKTAVMKFVKDENGLTIVEYAVAGGIITVGVVLAFGLLGTSVDTQVRCINSAVNGAVGAGC
jgi:pilus assembly protein Flp/PilA